MLDTLNQLIEQKLSQSHQIILDRLLSAKPLQRFNGGRKVFTYTMDDGITKIVIGTIDDINPKRNEWKFKDYVLAFWNYRPVLCDKNLLVKFNLTQDFKLNRPICFSTFGDWGEPDYPTAGYNPPYYKNSRPSILLSVNSIPIEEEYDITEYDLNWLNNEVHSINSSIIIMEDYDAILGTE